MRRVAPVLLLLIAPSLASAEALWLRGDGDRVWVERGEQVSDPQPDREGFSSVESTEDVGLAAREPMIRETRYFYAGERYGDGVEFGPVTMRDYDRAYNHRRYDYDRNYDAARWRYERSYRSNRYNIRRNYQTERFRRNERYEYTRRNYDLRHRRSYRRGRLNDRLD